jgi:superfamily II DNA or RNA helicase
MLTFDIEPNSTGGHRGILRGYLTPRIYDVFQGLPGRKKLKSGTYFFEWSNANVEYLLSKIPEAQWSPEAEAKKAEIVILREVEAERRSAKNRPIPKEIAEFPFKKKPFDHQLKAFALSRDLEAYGLFMEQGTGKSKVLIDTAAHLFSTGEIDCLVVIAPNGVHTQWVKEQLPDHMPDFVPWKGYYHESGAKKPALEKLKEVSEYTDGLKVITIHIEAISSASGETFLRNTLLQNRCLLVVDESSKIKTPAAKRTKAIIALAKLAKYRRIATGTPITQGVQDIYSQFMFLDKNILGHNSYFSFTGRYCNTHQFEFNNRRISKIIGYKHLDELTDRIEGNSFRVTKVDCLDLPERFFIDEPVYLTDQQQELYNSLKKELYIELEGQVITAPLVITALLRLQQILSGFIPNPEDGAPMEIASNRPNKAVSLVEESAGKVIIWTKFKHDVEMLEKAFQKAGIGYVSYTGATPQADRSAVIERFRNDTEVKVFISNPKTAGTGLNLTVASTVIWFSADFSLENYLQANDRCHRIGQTEKVTYYNLCSPNTIDAKIYKALADKENIAKMVIDVKGMLNV